MSNLELGRFGKKGNVETNAFNKNIKRNQVEDKKMQQIYDAFDKNKDGVLDKSEIENLQKSIFDAAGNGRLSQREADKLLKNMGVNELNGNDLLKFLNNMSQLPEVINNEVSELPDINAATAVSEEQAEQPVQEVITDVVQEDVPQEENPDKFGKTKTVDGKTYSVTYDGEGNTTGIIVQNGESIAVLAKKFGCTVEDIINANPDLVKGKGNNKYFLVGAEIKIPKELEPDDKALQNRQSKKEAIAAYEVFDTKRKAEAAEIASRKSISFTNNDYNTYEEMAKALFAKEGNQNPSKKMLEQRIQELQESNPDIRNGELKGKRINAKVNTEMHGRVVQRQEKMKEQRNDAVNTSNEILGNAKDDFAQQLAEDGWAGDVADGVSVLWNSKNRASKVREDIAAYENSMKELNEAANQGEMQFRAKFKEIYGVAYNPENIAEYKKNPTEENYKKAYGTKNDIAKRVAVYNQSQKDGASAVKTTVVIAASTGAAIASGGTSLLATAVVAGTSTMAARTITEVTDLATNDIEGDINAENLDNIAEQAMIEGAASAVTVGLAKGAGNLLGKLGSKTAAGAPKGGVPSAVPKAPASESGLVKSTVSSASSKGAKAGAQNGTGSAGRAGTQSGAKAGAQNGAKTAENAASSAGSRTNINLKFKNISDKISSNGGVNNLSAVERKEVADVLGVNPEKLTKLTKGEYRQLIVKFHPDKNPDNKEFAIYITQILNNIRFAA